LHGVAINCDVDLSWFDGIVPCGLPDHRATSLSRIVGRPVRASELRGPVVRAISDRLGLSMRSDQPQRLTSRFIPA
jgi:lipoyl(octanoyl) transferase